MNLHAAVRGAITAVNPDQAGVLLRSAGYRVDGAGLQLPTYYAPEEVSIQVQALSGTDLKHPDMVNMQGIYRAVYMYGQTHGVSRPDVQGGDLLQFGQTPEKRPQKWKVTTVLEPWGTAGWCKVAVCLQQ